VTLRLALPLALLSVLLLACSLAAGCARPDTYDTDGDGASDAEDCAPRDPAIHPRAAEDCEDGLDNDCDEAVDGADSDCADADEDGYPVLVDCDDEDPEVNPGAAEDCIDEVDNDCDGAADLADADCADADGDGYLPPVDCDDSDASVHPGAPEICDNGIDEDCDGEDTPCVIVEDCLTPGDEDSNGLADCDDPACEDEPGCDLDHSNLWDLGFFVDYDCLPGLMVSADRLDVDDLFPEVQAQPIGTATEIIIMEGAYTSSTTWVATWELPGDGCDLAVVCEAEWMGPFDLWGELRVEWTGDCSCEDDSWSFVAQPWTAD